MIIKTTNIIPNMKRGMTISCLRKGR